MRRKAVMLTAMALLFGVGVWCGALLPQLGAAAGEQRTIPAGELPEDFSFHTYFVQTLYSHEQQDAYQDEEGNVVFEVPPELEESVYGYSIKRRNG